MASVEVSSCDFRWWAIVAIAWMYLFHSDGSTGHRIGLPFPQD